jgi:hypothetical protein
LTVDPSDDPTQSLERTPSIDRATRRRLAVAVEHVESDRLGCPAPRDGRDGEIPV